MLMQIGKLVKLSEKAPSRQPSFTINMCWKHNKQHRLPVELWRNPWTNTLTNAAAMAATLFFVFCSTLKHCCTGKTHEKLWSRQITEPSILFLDISNAANELKISDWWSRPVKMAKTCNQHWTSLGMAHGNTTKMVVCCCRYYTFATISH